MTTPNEEGTMTELTKEEALNTIIKSGGIDTNQISDGYHTFGELYEHRVMLFITLCRWLDNMLHQNALNPHDGFTVWRSKKHSDGTEYEGWFVMGLGTEPGKQITYHLPMKVWNLTEFANEFERAPKWDGHTSADVLERIKML